MPRLSLDPGNQGARSEGRFRELGPLGFTVWGLGFRGSGFRVEGFGV